MGPGSAAAVHPQEPARGITGQPGGSRHPAALPLWIKLTRFRPQAALGRVLPDKIFLPIKSRFSLKGDQSRRAGCLREPGGRAAQAIAPFGQLSPTWTPG